MLGNKVRVACQKRKAVMTFQMQERMYNEQRQALFAIALRDTLLRPQITRNQFQPLLTGSLTQTAHKLGPDYDSENIAKLESIYETVDDIEGIVGGHLEKPKPGAKVGPTFFCIIVKQFLRVRRCDRFFFEHQEAGFTNAQLKEIRKTTLAGFICENGNAVEKMQTYAFKTPVTSPVAGDAPDDLIITLPTGSKVQGHILKSFEGNDFQAFENIPYAEAPVGKNRLKALPVYLWIYGGSFNVGYGTLYNPKFLIDYDIIIVTINYRLGVLGFLTTNDDNIPANLGLKDQLLALQWVHDNIIAFGGDPNQVTIGGESAGSISVGFHWLNKQARGLFTGIIQQSGSPLSSFLSKQGSREIAFEYGRQLNNSFNSSKSSDLLVTLQEASLSDILKLQKNVDVDSDLFKQRAKFYDENPKEIPNEALNIAEENKEHVGAALRKHYTNSSFEEDALALIQYTSDEVFGRSVGRQADAASRYVPVYMYQLSWYNKSNQFPGVEHTADLHYFWDFTPQEASHNDTLRKPLFKWWTNFIKYG
ncbi:unnamed protein product [Diabrotica balteata]|uniref:Carboxylic ester hydrolase n=1 Tax=Diabrotica balteata TaxID=107213 RepID=A0A9N9SM34_DIABA|nr:unnamed protein product [Diabrotica balteata]